MYGTTRAESVLREINFAVPWASAGGKPVSTMRSAGAQEIDLYLRLIASAPAR
jgi:hypothetical protein